MQVDIPLCPTLRPSFEEFKNFESYVEKVQKEYRGEYGMVKIVPPKLWKSRCQNYDKIKNSLIIEKPEFQTLFGNPHNFYFTCQNRRSSEISVQEYLNRSKKLEKDKPSHKDHSEVEKQVTLINTQFWSIFNTLNQELYGANVESSLMDSSSGQWEFSNLHSFFSEIVKEKIHGLNTSFLFFGAWKTFFNWHIEDLDLSAINLLHEGAPKVWYCIHPSQRRRFQDIMAGLYKQQSINCPNFMRHKQCFLNPYKLKQRFPDLKISKTFQAERQISLAFAEGYHSGFNTGFNIAEAVNYGTAEWFSRYARFKGCKCSLQIGVKLQHSQMIENINKNEELSKLKQLPAYKALNTKLEKDNKPNKLFQEADSAEIEAAIKKQKTKPINKGQKNIFVPKYNRYFPAEKQTFIQCDSCQKWRKVAESVMEKFQGKKKVKCDQFGFTCKGKKNETFKKKGQKNKK